MRILRFLLLLLLAVLILLLPAACGEALQPEDLPGSYLYEKEGFGGNFVICLHEDGSFAYTVGMLSSYLGVGQWTLENGVVCLADQNGRIINYFLAEKKGTLTFREQGSTNFIYLKVSNGEKFQIPAE